MIRNLAIFVVTGLSLACCVVDKGQSCFSFRLSICSLEVDKRATELLAPFSQSSSTVIASTRLWIDEECCLYFPPFERSSCTCNPSSDAYSSRSLWTFFENSRDYASISKYDSLVLACYWFWTVNLMKSLRILQVHGKGFWFKFFDNIVLACLIREIFHDQFCEQEHT